MIFKNLIRTIIIISQQRLLTHCDIIKLPLGLKLIGKLLQLISSPSSLIKKPPANFGKRLTIALQQLGPIYIKLGQTLSTRSDLVGIDIANELKSLQDKLPAFSSDIAKELIKQALGTEIENLFINFDNSPVAAASISQVHKAQLKNGKFVAVKILRPQIKQRYSRDIELLYFLAKLLSKKMKRLKPVEVINTFRNTMYQELNLKLEAAAASEIAENFKQDASLHIPEIYWQLTCENILISEWVDGTSIYDTSRLVELGINPVEISRKIAVIFFNQAYRDGFFHADLHPGNILVRDDGVIILLDFGIMGRLQDSDRLAIAEIIAAFLKRDYKLLAKLHLKIGYVPKNTNLDNFAMACRAVCEPIIDLPITQTSIGKLLMQLFAIAKEFGMETQEQLLLLQKTMVVVEGIGRHLDPNINMWELAKPWIKKWGAKNLSPEAKIIRICKQMIEDFIDRTYKKR